MVRPFKKMLLGYYSTFSLSLFLFHKDHCGPKSKKSCSGKDNGFPVSNQKTGDYDEGLDLERNYFPFQKQGE
jgi:hypothetical protein